MRKAERLGEWDKMRRVEVKASFTKGNKSGGYIPGQIETEKQIILNNPEPHERKRTKVRKQIETKWNKTS